MKKTAFTLFLALILTQAFAQFQYLKSTKEAHEKAEMVLKMITQGESEKAFDVLKPYWPLDESQIDGLGTTTAQQIPMLEEQFGALKGYEFVKSESLASFAYLEEYVIKYEQSALRFYVVFYNAGDGWLVNSLRWDDKWYLLFDENLKGED